MASMRRSPILRWWRPRQKEMEALEALSRLAGPRQSLVRAEAPSHPAEAPTTGRPVPAQEAFPRNGARSPTMPCSLWAILTYGEARALQTARTALALPCLSWPTLGYPCPTALRPRQTAENPSNPARCGLEIWYSIPAAAAGSTMWPFISATARWSMPPVSGTGIKISSWNYRSPSKIVNVLGD